MIDGENQVSVVIPTLGGESLKGTIDHLNAGSIVPAEILICIPAEDSHRVSEFAYPNVKVLRTDCRGQVAQRSIGFRHAAFNLVLQIDDDIVVERDCLELLVEALNYGGENCAVAPSLRWHDNKESLYKATLNPFMLKAFYWFLNGSAGYRAGTVTVAGTGIGVDPETSGCESVAAQWLPGGCVLHRKVNLVLDDYFPFKGKAFCEDLIHSFLLTRRSIRLIVNTKAVSLVFRPEAEPLRQCLKAWWTNLRSRRYYVRLTSRSMPRMYFYFLALIVRQLTIKQNGSGTK